MADKPVESKAVKATRRALDRFAQCADTGRLSSSLVDLLEDEPFSRISTWAEQMTTLAEAIEEAQSHLSDWREADDREDKAEAKEQALEALQNVVDAWNACDLDVAVLEDWVPDADDEAGL